MNRRSKQRSPMTMAPLARAPSGGSQIAGTVVEAMNAAGYTYARLEDGSRSIWVAGPLTKLAVGTRLGAMSGMLMTGFHSDTLKRTFEQIYFVDSYAVPAAATAVPAAASEGDLSGRVAETMNAGGYTYARVDHGGASVWLAGPQTPLAVGTTLGAMSGTLMTGFHSPTLDRTFDRIYFVSRFAVTAAAAVTTAGSGAAAAHAPAR